ncbi:MAG TPA: GxxExxY protein [Candidatus Sulfotelmatobacter sp.]|nr:GxxExxY protein [Candidatus Sulfotelmatobacter sp.]
MTPQTRFSAQEISHAIISAALRVHSDLGPGLLERAYQACLRQELLTAGLRCDIQVPLPVVYKGVKLDIGYRIDLLVQDLVIVEIKSVEAISPVHQVQVISYRKLSGKSLGLLMNFNVVHLKDGIRRFVSGTQWRISA